MSSMSRMGESHDTRRPAFEDGRSDRYAAAIRSTLRDSASTRIAGMSFVRTEKDSSPWRRVPAR